MKKLLSLVLAIAMVFSTFTFAFAFEDVPADNAELTNATNLMNALGIVNGYDDGTFRPEKQVKRAEMAKMLILAQGYGDIATDTSSFLDCQGHWAEGYIALANDLGIIQGKGNGVFDPEAYVTYEQAAIMILRTLGYNNATLNNGKDVYNAAAYKTKALQVGLFDVLGKVSMKGNANRGDIALMINVGLQSPMVDTIEGKAVYVKDENEDRVLLISKIATVDKEMVVKVDDLDDGHIVDLTDYLFQSIKVYKNDDGKVVYVAKSNVKTYNTNIAHDKTDTAATKVKFINDDDTTLTLDLANAKTPVFYNGALTTKTEAQIEAKDVAVKVVLNADKEICGMVIEEFDAPTQVVLEYINKKTKFGGYKLPTDKDGKVDFDNVTVTGAATAIEDIEEKDIIEVAQAEDESVIKYVVTREVVEGKVTKVRGAKFYIDGNAYYSNGVTLSLGDEGTFYLDRMGDIAAFSSVAQQDTYNYAIVLGLADGSIGKDDFSENLSISTYPRLKVVGMDGKVQILPISVVLNTDGSVKSNAIGVTVTRDGNDLDLDLAIATDKVDVSGHNVISYTLDSKDRIKTVKPVDLKDIPEIKTSSVKFLADDNTVIFNRNSDNTYTLTNVDGLKTDKISVQYVGDVKGWSLVIAGNALATQAANVPYGVVTGVADTFNDDGDPVHEIYAIVDGEETSFFTIPDYTITTPSAIKGKVVAFTLDTDGKTVKLVKDATATATAIPTEVNSSYILLKDINERFYISDEVVVYVEGAKQSVSVGDLADVRFIVNENQKIKVYDIDGDDYVDIIFICK